MLHLFPLHPTSLIPNGNYPSSNWNIQMPKSEFSEQSIRFAYGTLRKQENLPKHIVQKRIIQIAENFRSTSGCTPVECHSLLLCNLYRSIHGYSPHNTNKHKDELAANPETDPIKTAESREPSPDHHAEIRDELVWLQSKLPRVQLEFLEYVKHQTENQLSNAAMAEILKMSVAAYKTMKCRAMASIRQRLDE